jgi:sugar lactone lactonase YvrE
MRRLFLLFATVVVCLSGALGFGQESTEAGKAAVPRLVRFSGTAKEATGRPQSGVVELTFPLYREEEAGDALWFETQTVETDAQGRYSALLGATCSDGLPADLFTSGEARGRPDSPLVASLTPQAVLTQGNITTVAGGGPNNVPAVSAGIEPLTSVAVDRLGNFYFAPPYADAVYKVDVSGRLTIVAGNGTQAVQSWGTSHPYGGDGGPATSGQLFSPEGVAVDAFGNLFIAETAAFRIRRVDAITGIIMTVAGNGTQGDSGDGGLATSAALGGPNGVGVDTAGNVFITDTHRIRRVDAITGIITTVAGNGFPGFSGDGGAAASAELNYPYGVAADTAGNLFIADVGNSRIRRVDAATGIIMTVAGIGGSGYSGDGGPATSAAFFVVHGVAVDAAGNLFIADSGNDCIRRVDAITGIITTVAGNGSPGFSGDAGPATSAALNLPYGVAVDASGNLFVAEYENHRIRRIDGVTGIITTVAGDGTLGNGGPAVNAALALPRGVSVDVSGNLFVADFNNYRIRRVNTTTGTITDVATSWSQPLAVAVDASGNIFFSDFGRIRRVDAITATITTVAGNLLPGFSGDGGPATSAELNYPQGLAVDPAGNLFIADSGNERLRRVDAATGIIMTVAGNGTHGYSGDGGPATSATFDGPYGVAVDAAGNLFISDWWNSCIRRVDAITGIITTVAGNGFPGFSGDGGLAASAVLSLPQGVAFDAFGNLFIADMGNSRIRGINAIAGIIMTVAGNRTKGFSGDGGASISAELSNPSAVAVDDSGNLFIADTFNNRVRQVNLPPLVAFSANALSFTSQPMGGTSEPQTVTLTNAGFAQLNLTGIDTSGDFAYTSTCSGALAAGLNCTISVTFAPTGIGTRTGTLTVTDNAPGSPHQVVLSGAGPDFTMSVSAGGDSKTVNAGQTATYNLTIVPSDFTGTVALSCAWEDQQPRGTNCTVSPTSVNLEGRNPAPFTVTVTTTARSLAGPRPDRWPQSRGRQPVVPLAAFLLGLTMLLTILAVPRNRRVYMGLAASMLVIVLWVSCGGGGGGGAPPPPQTGTPTGTYTLTIAGTAAGVSRTTSLILAVN